MDVPIIHVHTQSDKSTVEYARFMWETMRKLATHPGSLRLSLHGIGPTACERLKDMPDCTAYYVPNADRDKGMSGSTAHGACIEHALLMTDDGDIHIIVDSDTVVMAKGWDDYVRTQLLDAKVGTVGTTYEDVGGFTSGGGNVQTYKGVPNVVWMALSPLHKWRDLRAMPAKDSDIHVINEGQAKVYGLPVGYHVLRDVGWQIPEYLNSRGITYVGWKQLKPTKDAVILKGLSDYHEEYHVGEAPFIVHHRGSMRHAYRGDRISQNFYDAVDRWLADEAGRQPRWTWQPTPENADVLNAMAAAREQAKTRPMHAAHVPVGTQVATDVTHAPINGWLKASLDGDITWGRYTQPVPATVDIAFTPDQTGKHLRLEGTVSGVTIALPGTKLKPFWMTVRNMTAGIATLRASEGNKTVEVPIGSCWQVLIDVDGVVKID